MASESERRQEAHDEDFYDYAVNELQSGQFSKPLWSKALAKSAFDENKAKGVYVDLRVEQLKANVAVERESAEVREETKKTEKEIRSLEMDLQGKKLEAAFSDPMFLIQVAIVSSAAGLHQESWIVFFIVVFAIFISMAIPFLNNLVGLVLAGLFGYLGFVLGLEWWSQSAGFWIGGIAFLVVLSTNINVLRAIK